MKKSSMPHLVIPRLSMSRRGNILLSVIALSSLMLALTLALTIKVQANMQASAQIRKFAQSYLIAGVVHTRWPRMKSTDNAPDPGRKFLAFQINFWDLGYDHYWKTHEDAGTFVTPPALLGYFYSQDSDIPGRCIALCNGGSKSTGFNDVGANGGVGSGWAYDYCLSFVCDETGKFPDGAHMLSPADPTFPRLNSDPGLALRTGNQLAQVLPP